MWQRLMERLDDTLLLAAIALVFCLIRTVVVPSTRTVKYYLGMFIVSIPVGTLAGQFAHESGFTDTGALMATALASLLAQDIVTAVLRNSVVVDRAIKRIVDKWMGGS